MLSNNFYEPLSSGKVSVKFFDDEKRLSSSSNNDYSNNDYSQPPILDEEDEGGNGLVYATSENGNINGEDQDIIKDLDSFFRNVYNYHRYHGYAPYVMRALRKLFVTTCGILVFYFLSLCFNWSNFIECGRHKDGNPDEDGKDACKEIIENANGGWFTILLNILYTLHLCYLVYLTFRKIKTVRKMNLFYTRVLKITPKMIAQGITWAQVVEKIIQCHENGEIGNIRQTLTLSFDIISSFLTRDENFLTCILQEDALELNYGESCISPCNDDNSCEQKDFLFSKLLVWIIKTVVVDNISKNGRLTKNMEFLSPLTSNLQTRMILLGSISLLFSPILIIRQVSMEFFKLVQQFYASISTASSSTSSTRDWSRYAKMLLRKYNEDDHSSSKRLKDYSVLAETLTSCYPNYVVKELVLALTSITTLIIGLIILFTLNDTSMLFNITIGGQPLLFLLGFLTPTAYVCCKYLATFKSYASIQNISLEKRKLIDGWIDGIPILLNSDTNNDDTKDTRKDIELGESGENEKMFKASGQIKKYYKHKLQLSMNELLGNIFLCIPLFKIAYNSNSILHFLNKKILVDKNVGVICRQPVSSSLNWQTDNRKKSMKEAINDIMIRQV
jgi:hypothetical protein